MGDKKLQSKIQSSGGRGRVDKEVWGIKKLQLADPDLGFGE